MSNASQLGIIVSVDGVQKASQDLREITKTATVAKQEIAKPVPRASNDLAQVKNDVSAIKVSRSAKRAARSIDALSSSLFGADSGVTKIAGTLGQMAQATSPIEMAIIGVTSLFQHAGDELGKMSKELESMPGITKASLPTWKFLKSMLTFGGYQPEWEIEKDKDYEKNQAKKDIEWRGKMVSGSMSYKSGEELKKTEFMAEQLTRSMIKWGRNEQGLTAEMEKISRAYDKRTEKSRKIADLQKELTRISSDDREGLSLEEIILTQKIKAQQNIHALEREYDQLTGWVEAAASKEEALVRKRVERVKLANAYAEETRKVYEETQSDLQNMRKNFGRGIDPNVDQKLEEQDRNDQIAELHKENAKSAVYIKKLVEQMKTTPEDGKLKEAIDHLTNEIAARKDKIKLMEAQGKVGQAQDFYRNQMKGFDDRLAALNKQPTDPGYRAVNLSDKVQNATAYERAEAERRKAQDEAQKETQKQKIEQDRAAAQKDYQQKILEFITKTQNRQDYTVPEPVARYTQTTNAVR